MEIQKRSLTLCERLKMSIPINGWPFLFCQGFSYSRFPNKQLIYFATRKKVQKQVFYCGKNIIKDGNKFESWNCFNALILTQRETCFLAWTKQMLIFSTALIFSARIHSAPSMQYYAQSNKFAKKIWKNMCTSWMFHTFGFHLGIYFSAQFLTWFHRR